MRLADAPPIEPALRPAIHLTSRHRRAARAVEDSELESHDLPRRHEVAANAAIHTHHRGLIHYLLLLGCDSQTADDIAQETFLVFLRKGFSGEHGRLARFLRRTARFLFLDYLRAQARWDRASEATANTVEAAWEAGQVGEWSSARLDALRRCEQKLNGRRLEVVRLFYTERLSRDEVAQRVGMKESGVKTLLQRVRQELRQCIEEQTQ